MRKLFFFLCVAIVFTGCSEDDDNSPEPTQQQQTEFRLWVNNIEMPLYSPTAPDVNFDIRYLNYIGPRTFQNGLFRFRVSFQAKNLDLTMDKSGNVVSVTLEDNTLGGLYYRNYANFPSHYFQTELIELDEVNHHIKLNFTGKVYTGATDLNSESINLHGEIDMDYNEVADLPGIFDYHMANDEGVEAKLNGQLWRAADRKYDGTFFSPDAYIFRFAPTQLGAVDFAADAANNYARLWKFNPDTLQYDLYACTGTMNVTFKENWGSYSMYEGTFSMTAVNTQNPSDIMTVTDGRYRFLRHN